jgi:hypothetical protein
MFRHVLPDAGCCNLYHCAQKALPGNSDRIRRASSGLLCQVFDMAYVSVFLIMLLVYVIYGKGPETKEMKYY